MLTENRYSCLLLRPLLLLFDHMSLSVLRWWWCPSSSSITEKKKKKKTETETGTGTRTWRGQGLFNTSLLLLARIFGAPSTHCFSKSVGSSFNGVYPGANAREYRGSRLQALRVPSRRASRIIFCAAQCRFHCPGERRRCHYLTGLTLHLTYDTCIVFPCPARTYHACEWMRTRTLTHSRRSLSCAHRIALVSRRYISLSFARINRL